MATTVTIDKAVSAIDIDSTSFGTLHVGSGCAYHDSTDRSEPEAPTYAAHAL